MRFGFFLSLLWVSIVACSHGGPPSTVAAESAPAATPQPQPQPPPSRFGDGVSCGEVALAKRPLRYCVYDPKGVGTSDRSQVSVIYYFHGLGGQADDLFSADGKNILRNLELIFGNNQPIYVGLSVGNEGVIGNEAQDIVARGLPAAEQAFAPGKTVRRIAMGGSMGGHNSLRLAAEVPGTFAAVAALCPALATFDAYDPQQVEAYIARHRPYLDRGFFEKALAKYKEQLPTPEIWKANNPFTYLERGAYDGLPLFLSVGREDTVGFIEGVREFKIAADRRPNMNVEVHEVTGPHCVFDVPSFLRFMARVR